MSKTSQRSDTAFYSGFSAGRKRGLRHSIPRDRKQRRLYEVGFKVGQYAKKYEVPEKDLRAFAGDFYR